MAIQKQPDPPPRPPCDDCRDAGFCVMRGAVCRELMITWADGVQAENCPLYEPDSYHGVEGCRA